MTVINAIEITCLKASGSRINPVTRPPRLRLSRLRCAYNAMLLKNHSDCSLGSSRQRQFSILPDDPLPTTANLSWREEYTRGNCKVNIHAAAHLSVCKEHYRIEARLKAFANSNRVSADLWNGEIPCDPGGK